MIVLAVMVVLSGIAAFFALKYAPAYQQPSTDQKQPSTPALPPETATTTPSTIPPTTPESDTPRLSWGTPPEAYHSTRVMCDDAGLTYMQKNILCACIYQESQFDNGAVGRNIGPKGNVLSTDWGLCQINDYYHTGQGKDFPSAAYVVAHPEEAVAFMIRMFKVGQLKLWVSYSSGAYKTWLSPSSPMWALADAKIAA